MLQEEQDILNDLGTPNHIGFLRFTDQDIQDIMYIHDDRMTNLDWRAMWLAQTTAPGVPADEDRLKLYGMMHNMERTPDPARPWWLPRLAFNRDLCQGIAIGRRGEKDTAWLFLLAKKKPYAAVFMRLHLCPYMWPDPSTDDGDPPRPWNQLDYSMHPAEFVEAHNVNFDEGDELFVVEGLRFCGDVVSSPHKARQFDAWYQHLPAPSRAAGRAAADPSPRPTKNMMRQLLEKYPWMSAGDFDLAVRSADRGRPHARGFSRALLAVEFGEDAVQEAEMAEDSTTEIEPDVVGEELEDSALRTEIADMTAAVASDLLTIREEWRVDADDLPDTHFQVRILGGTWTKVNKGVAADTVGGWARSALSKQFCRRCEWPKQRTYAFARYGHLGANHLAREFCRLSQFVLELWVAGGAAFMFEEEQFRAYAASASFVLWAESLADDDDPMHRFCRGAIDQLFALRPVMFVAGL